MTLRKRLDKVIKIQYFKKDVLEKVKSISKGKNIVPYWTKKVIN